MVSLPHEGTVAVREISAEAYAVVDDLEHFRGTLEILLFLYREGPATAYRLRERLRPGPEAIQHCLNHLTQMRLARPTRSHSYPFGRLYGLTDLGRDLVDSPVRAWPYVLAR
jgi:DNA-binding HxlR family transcriptional regulator